MKAVRFLIVLAMLLVAVGAAQGAVKAVAFTYTSGIQVQNLEASDAAVTLTFYVKDSTEIDTTVTDTIAANGSKTYFPIGASEGFDGSVVISSDKKVAAISNVLGNGNAAAASYVAASAGSTEVLLPLLMQNNAGYSTWFNVQNTGSSVATVNVAYSDGTAAGPLTVEPGSAHTFDQLIEIHTEKVFSAVVTSDVPVAVTVIEESSAILYAYTGFAPATNVAPVMPLINANNVGYATGAQIQNAGATDTEVTVTYTPASFGTACTETQTIPAGTSKTFTLGAFAGSLPPGATSDCVGLQRFVGSAKVTGNSADMPLYAIVNQLNATKPDGEAYGAFDAATATDTVVLPLVMDRNSGWWTGFNVQNVGAAATTVECTFTGNAYTTGGTLQPGEALNALQNGAIAAGYVGSATCTAPGGQIVAVVNELGPLSSGADQLLVYEGVTP